MYKVCYIAATSYIRNNHRQLQSQQADQVVKMNGRERIDRIESMYMYVPSNTVLLEFRYLST